MTKTLPATALAVLAGICVATTAASMGPTSQQCEQVRDAVATYGYKAALAHARAHYSREEVEAGEACLHHDHARRAHHGHAHRGHRRHHEHRKAQERDT